MVIKYLPTIVQRTQTSFTRPTFTLLFLFLLTIFLTHCTFFNGTRFEDTLGSDTNLIKFSYTIADNLIESAIPPLVPRHPDMPILVTTFVDNNDLKKTSKFGRILQEHISSRLVQLGYTVREIKMASTLSIVAQHGETILSRDLSLLGKTQDAQAILVGTISHTNRTMYISSRFINPGNNNIVATDDSKLIMDDNVLAMFGMKRVDKNNDTIEEPSQPLLNSVLY